MPLLPCRPWFSQGDVFAAIPQVSAVVSTNSGIEWRSAQGPALLITHGCALDKPRASRARITSLQFLPLIAVSQQDQNRQAVVRANELEPYEAFYIGDVPGLADSFVMISEVFSLPAKFFEPELVDYSGHEGVEPDEPPRLTATKNDGRIVRLDERQIDMLHRKIQAFWTRMSAPFQ